MQTTFVVLHSFSFARPLAFHLLSFTHITFTRFLSLSHSPSVFFVCVPPVCVRVYLSLSAHDDISCLHVLLLMMRGTLHNTSEAVTHDFMHDCFMILLDNAFKMHTSSKHAVVHILWLFQLNCILSSLLSLQLHYHIA